jgi:hypothetical protein
MFGNPDTLKPSKLAFFESIHPAQSRRIPRPAMPFRAASGRKKLPTTNVDNRHTNFEFRE